MTDSLGMTVPLAVPFAAAVQRTRDALKTEGFGVLTEIDMQAAFREKLGRDFRPYVILGACNPPLAYNAISADPRVGLLLPCNVTVEATDDGGSVVRMVNPFSMMSAGDLGASPEIAAVAADAHARLSRAAKMLGTEPAPAG